MPRTQNQRQQQQKSFLIRSLKQGSTGAVKTWPACEVLLEYLVRWGGLRDTEEKLDATASTTSAEQNASTVLDMTSSGNGSGNGMSPPSPSSTIEFIDPPTMADDPTLNIVELGGGNGTLGVGLAMALNGTDEANTSTSKTSKSGFRPNARIMCTDKDHRTVKNMRFNVTQQPKECKIGKAVRAESLDWGHEIGGEDFASRVEDQFGGSLKNDQENVDGADNSPEDPMQLVTHVIGSDIHFGHTTLDPLSSVIAAFKLRNPQINVTLLMKERNPENYADVADLATEIEAKVSKGLEEEDDNSTIGDELQDFSVSVRDVLHDEIENMKLLEC